MSAVPRSCPALVRRKGGISTFAAIQIKEGDGKVSIPEGVIVIEGGKKRWRALVEVKTESVALQPEQLSRYLDPARDQGSDAVLTISNQITARPMDSPVAVDKRTLKRVDFYHVSWWRIITEAAMQHSFRGVSDPGQARILDG